MVLLLPSAYMAMLSLIRFLASIAVRKLRVGGTVSSNWEADVWLKFVSKSAG